MVVQWWEVKNHLKQIQAKESAASGVKQLPPPVVAWIDCTSQCLVNRFEAARPELETQEMREDVDGKLR